MSAGTRSPPRISTTSPKTSSSAKMLLSTPSRTTLACCGNILAKDSMIRCDLAFCAYRNTPVMTTTTNRTIAKYSWKKESRTIFDQILPSREDFLKNKFSLHCQKEWQLLGRRTARRTPRSREASRPGEGVRIHRPFRGGT